MQSFEPLSNDASANLTKILQIYRKQTKFTVFCPYLNLELKSSMTSIHPKNELADQCLRTLWVIFQQSYFKPIESFQFSILSFLDCLINERCSQKNEQQEYQQFILEINSLYSDEFFDSLRKDEQSNSSELPWIKKLFCAWKKRRPILKNYNNHDYKFSKDSSKKESEKQTLLQTSQKSEKSEEKCELDKLINELEQQLGSTEEEIRVALESIWAGISSEKTALLQNQVQLEGALQSNSQHLSHKISNTNDQLKYLKHQILILQNRQIADSILQLKATSIAKTKYYYAVTFESALNLPEELLTQSKFVQLNKLRQISLLNYYFTGWKSKFNYTCHNFYGFASLQNERSNIGKHRKEISLSELKKCSKRTLQSFDLSTFNSMEMCHQCKCAYEKKNLKKCQYSSQLPQLPTPLIYDPYFQAILKQKTASNLAQLFAKQQHKACYEQTKRASKYARYVETNGIVSCNRYYCKLCLKAYSHLKISHLCPFCQGVCHCSRCLRNDTIFKLKSLFVKLGGSPNELKDISHFDNLFNSAEKNIKSPQKEQLIPRFVHSRVVYIQKQLKSIRLMSHLLKNRQNLKLKLAKQLKQIFLSNFLQKNYHMNTS